MTPKTERRPIAALLHHLPRFIGFVYSRFPMARLALGLTLLATAIEYTTFSLMLPLSGQSGGKAASTVLRAWTAVAESVGLPTGTQTWLWLFLVLLACRVGLEFVLVWTNNLLSRRVHRFFSDSMFAHIIAREPMTAIYRRPIGHYVQLAGDDAFRTGNVILYFGQVVAAVLDAMAGFVLLFVFSPRVFLATLVFVAASVAVVVVLLSFQLRLNLRSASESRIVGTYFVDALNGIRSLRSMAAERFVVENYQRMIKRYLHGLVRMEILKQAMRTGPALLLVLVGVAWAWPGSTLTNQARGALYFVALTMLLVRVLVALGAVVSKGERLVSDIRAAHDIDELLATASGDPLPLDRPGQLVGPSIGTISFADVWYRYDDGPDVLRGVSQRMQAGRSYSLVGDSGAGKSTLADVLLGLVQPTSGVVAFDDSPAGGAAARRGRVVLVEQQTRIFTGSLRENILLGHLATDAEVAEAVEASGLSEIVATEAGLDRDLQYQGANLSGGQRQRVGLARALVRKPNVLILDEATSALDSTVRDKVLDAVQASMRGGILILITHDLDVARRADVVLRMAGGKIVPFEQGPTT